MRVRPEFWKHWALIGLGGLLLAGCGTGAYRERMERRIEELSRGMPGQDLLSDVTPLPGTPLEVRVPPVFQKALSPKSGSEKPARRTPPFTLPGLLGTWEAHLDQGGLKQPYYFYLGLTDASQNPQPMIEQQLRQEWPDLSIQWNEFPDALGRPWKRCHVVLADLEWVPLDAGGQEKPVQKATGRVDIFCLQDGRHWIVAACRVPESIADQVRLEDLYRPVLANLKVKQ